MRSIGYQQAGDFLLGKLPESELVEAITVATRQYAKRQMTWFRSLTFQARYQAAEPLDVLVDRIRAWLN
jgi:tRNA dimethylallyltransferase